MNIRKRWTILDIDENVIKFIKNYNSIKRYRTGKSLEDIIKSSREYKKFVKENGNDLQ